MSLSGLRKLMAEHDLPLRELADKIGIKPSELSDIVQGQRMASSELIDRMATALGVSFEEMAAACDIAFLAKGHEPKPGDVVVFQCRPLSGEGCRVRRG